MTFTVGDFKDLLRLLEEHPEWRAQLRQHVLPEELLALPELVRSLAEAQRHTDEQLAVLARQVQLLTARMDALTAQVQLLTVRMDALTARVDALTVQVEALTARVDALTARVDALTAQVEALTVRMDALTAQVEALTARVDALTVRMDALTARVDALTVRMDALTRAVESLTAQLQAQVGRIGEMDGELMELRFARRAPSYLGRLARRIRVLEPSVLADLLDDAVEAGHLTEPERESVMLADVVARGPRRPDGAEAYFVTEVSAGIGVGDVRRVLERSHLLEKLGQPVVPVVAGRWVNDEAGRYAHSSGVQLIIVPRKHPGIEAEPTAA
ncbi:MAG: hypothetical protein HYX52_02710 [Chloroflexi bacterium]|nr:hypothetical protein [Chloroflexota bacterium]